MQFKIQTNFIKNTQFQHSFSQLSLSKLCVFLKIYIFLLYRNLQILYNRTENKKSLTLFMKTNKLQNSSKYSPKQPSTYLPSFSGISSNTSFQQTSNSMKISQRQALSISQSITNLEELIMINDGVEYIFNFTDSGIDSDDIFDIFEEITKDNDFQMIERQQNFCTAIKQVKNSSLLSKLNISELFFGCFTFLQSGNQRAHIKGQSLTSNSPSAIKIVVSKIIHEQKQMKMCRIKGISGLVRQIRIFIDKFKQKISQYIPQESRNQNNCFFYDPDKQTEHENKKSIQRSDPYHLEISTYYVIQKILSNNVYQIGAITHSLINDYMNTFQNIEESVGLIPQPINNAVKIVNQIYHWFSTHNNIKQNKNQNKQKKQQQIQQSLIQQEDKDSKVIKKIPLHESMTPFLRVSIQKYIFQRLSYPIFDIYMFKNKENQQIFVGKRARIFQKYSTRQILEQISLNKKFWSIDSDKQEEIDHIHTIKETKALLKMSTQCCAQLQKIPLSPNPRQKIKHIELAYTSLKTFYYDYSKQKYELSSMEDIIPVLILIVLLLNVENLRKELDIVGDFIQSDPYEMQSQKRLYINLSESYNYILRDWKI